MNSFDATTPIVVFGLSPGTLHHGALGIARSAGRLHIPVYRVGRERWAPAALSRFSRGWTTIAWNESDERILDTLDTLARRIGRAILVPVDDAGSVFVDTHTAALERNFLFPRQPRGLAQELSSKREMYNLCQQHSVPTPVSQFPRSEAELLELAAKVSFPTVAKCINAGDAPPASPRVAIAMDRADLLHAYRQMESPKGANVMIQEFVPGTPESVWMFNGYFDERSECKVAFTGKKIRQAPPYTGAATLGVCEANAAVLQDTVRLMKAVGYRGILDIGFRFDARDGQYKLLDVNPRIGATFRLFVGPDGMDVLRAMYLDLTGQPVPRTSQSEGRRWIVEPLDVASSLTYLRRRDITPLGWVRSLRGVREAAWFARDDPAPFIALCIWVLFWWLPRRLLRRR
jgi:predicted ATP-grasp superfamily ATP-dependent carboligase